MVPRAASSRCLAPSSAKPAPQPRRSSSWGGKGEACLSLLSARGRRSWCGCGGRRSCAGPRSTRSTTLAEDCAGKRREPLSMCLAAAGLLAGASSWLPRVATWLHFGFCSCSADAGADKWHCPTTITPADVDSLDPRRVEGAPPPPVRSRLSSVVPTSCRAGDVGPTTASLSTSHGGNSSLPSTTTRRTWLWR